MPTQKHCPGFEALKSLKVFMFRCDTCGREKEIFSDELSKKHICVGCGKEIDVSKCGFQSTARTKTLS